MLLLLLLPLIFSTSSFTIYYRACDNHPPKHDVGFFLIFHILMLKNPVVVQRRTLNEVNCQHYGSIKQ